MSPYMRVGKCVYHKNSDGSKGKKKGCSDSVEEAKKYLKALYAAESKSLAEFSMVITKATIPDKGDRTMRLSMVNSDTGEDAYEERMSVELFEDFIKRIEDNIPVPEPFDEVVAEENWNGGVPYLSVSHYKSGGGKNVPGRVERVYVDGNRLKSNAILNESPLGLAVWKSVCRDIEERSLEEKTFENPVRISIGFLDLQHKHEIEGEEDFIFTRSELKESCPKCSEGINGKVYLKGQLVHLAFTRVPANPRTQVEVQKMSDEIETKREDAESIIGDLAEELVGKSVVEDEALVVKAEEESRNEEPNETIIEQEETPEKSEVIMDEPKEVLEQEEAVEEVSQEVQEPAKSKIDVATENLKTKMLELKSKGITGDAALEALQPLFNDVGAVVKDEMTSPLDGVAEVVRSTVQDAMQGMKAEIVAEVLKALPKSDGTPANETPTPRSIIVKRNANPQQKEEVSQIRRIAQKSIFGQ